MAITQAMCSSFKQQLLEGVHDFRATGGHTFKVALYLSTAVLSASTTAYTATGESSGTNYTAGGTALTCISPTLSGTTAIADFADASWASATVTARGCLIYNTTPTHTYTNPAVCVLDFGSDKVATNGTFTIQFPVADAANAILRIA